MVGSGTPFVNTNCVPVLYKPNHVWEVLLYRNEIKMNSIYSLECFDIMETESNDIFIND